MTVRFSFTRSRNDGSEPNASCLRPSHRVGPVQHVDGDGAAGAGDAGADLAAVAPLALAEEDVAMVDLALAGDEVDGADAALAAAAIGDHLEAGVIERIEHRAVAWDNDL